ncbi:hypothetical protein K435DRAFT_248975 [Dendrothele bispora CBS 962.96]|uniref:Uncharacterized protein n=1 Tax=Dendrothele bispora (strain CBS 962.96) TaxID=1314807 RepID=A0A4S8LN73_DENBC|nr:hypothetical protein K435DRAFT_248975 [Dendrothele bispora CBS 962.96]
MPFLVVAEMSPSKLYSSYSASNLLPAHRKLDFSSFSFHLTFNFTGCRRLGHILELGGSMEHTVRMHHLFFSPHVLTKTFSFRCRLTFLRIFFVFHN